MTNRGMEYYSALQGRTLDLFNSSDESQKKKEYAVWKTLQNPKNMDWGETFCQINLILFKPTCHLLFVIVQGLKVNE